MNIDRNTPLWRFVCAIALLSLLVAACGSDDDEGAESDDQTEGPSATEQSTTIDENATIRLGFIAGVQTLDPHQSTSGTDPTNLSAVYPRLVGIEGDREIVPSLATDWTISDDGLEYLFTIREGVVADDGGVIDASAVKLSLERAATLEASRVTDKVALIDEMEALSPTELQVTLSEPHAGFLVDMASAAGLIISPLAIEEGRDISLDPGGAGAGPFEVVAFDPAERFVAEKKDSEHWDSDQWQFQRMEIIYIEDDQTALNALQTDAIDLVRIPGQPSSQVEAALEPAGYVTYVRPSDVVEGLLLNGSAHITSDLAVRQAIAHAVDREAISEGLLEDCAYTAQLFGESSPAHIEDGYDPFPYDPEVAEDLFQQSGVVGETLSIVLPAGGARWEAIATSTQQALQALGVEVVITEQPIREAIGGYAQGEFAVLAMAAVGDPVDEVDRMERVYLQPPYGIPGEAGLELEAALAEINAMPADAPEREEFLEAAATDALDQAWLIPFCRVDAVWGANDRVQGVEEMSNYWGATYDLRDLSIAAA